MDKIFSGTAEAVGRGHPDRIADAIAERLTWRLLDKNPKNRAAIEVLAAYNHVVVAGEIHGKLRPDEVEWVVNGYLGELKSYDVSKNVVTVRLQEQSSDIEAVQFRGARRKLMPGDQSIVVGCASCYGVKYLPIAQDVAMTLCRSLEDAIDSGYVEDVTHDYKIFVDIENREIKTLAISIEHAYGGSAIKLRHQIKTYAVKPALDLMHLVVAPANLHVNMGGKFTIGGLLADTGVTNRKPVCDTYGANVPHGGGGLNGKDLTKVDRLGAYFARYICKNLVCAAVCHYIELRLKFLPGETRFGWEIIEMLSDDHDLETVNKLIERVFHDRYTFQDMYEKFNQPSMYEGAERLCIEGHFMCGEFPWEIPDDVPVVHEALAAIQTEKIEGGLQTDEEY